MVTRNERNAIIQHGTMTLVRRALLERIGWAEWCITEDAELGLRIFAEGYDATYIARQLRPRPDARHVPRFQEAALALGVRGHAGPAPALRRA
ncbi:MAG: glycosyltransferase [Comamonadaceae bacterium]|nr:glycosyltransferase [Comamonadaceae bacterium]